VLLERLGLVFKSAAQTLYAYDVLNGEAGFAIAVGFDTRFIGSYDASYASKKV